MEDASGNVPTEEVVEGQDPLIDTLRRTWQSLLLLAPAPESPVAVAGVPISMIPRSKVKYPSFLAWWREVGRLNPTDPQGWSSVSGPWVMRGRGELIPPEEWAGLTESERESIKTWARYLPIGMFYD